MQTMSLRMPNYLKTAIAELCSNEKISLNQFILNALSEKVSALETLDIIQEKAKNASKADFLNALKLIPNNEPLEKDKLF